MATVGIKVEGYLTGWQPRGNHSTTGKDIPQSTEDLTYVTVQRIFPYAGKSSPWLELILVLNGLGQVIEMFITSKSYL